MLALLRRGNAKLVDCEAFLHIPEPCVNSLRVTQWAPRHKIIWIMQARMRR